MYDKINNNYSLDTQYGIKLEDRYLAKFIRIVRGTAKPPILFINILKSIMVCGMISHDTILTDFQIYVLVNILGDFGIC